MPCTAVKTHCRFIMTQKYKRALTVFKEWHNYRRKTVNIGSSTKFCVDGSSNEAVTYLAISWVEKVITHGTVE